MKGTLLIVLLTLGLGAASFARTKTEPDLRERVAVGDEGSRIVTAVAKMEAFGFSGAVLAAKDGKVIAATGVGNADIKGATPNTPATLFEIASVTKQFTAAAVMRLVQDGKIDLDAPIGLYLGKVPAGCEGITVRHLLNHTSGIPGSNSAGQGTDIGKALPVFLKGGPKRLPGTRFEYWNQGYAIVSEVIAKASGKDYTEYCQSALFGPTGMTATCFTGDAMPNVAGVTVAVGISAMGRPRSALEHPYGSYGLQYLGMGGVVTNVWDLWRWDRALHRDGEGSILSDASKKELFNPGLDKYALGWYVMTDSRGKTVQSHGGGVRGFACEVRRLPDDDGCVLVLSNRDDAPVRQLADRVQAILLGEAGADADLPGPLDAARAAELSGRYIDEKGNTLTVKVDGRAVRANIEWARQRGLMSRAHIGALDGGSIVLVESSGNTPVYVEQNAPGMTSALLVGPQRFSRK